MVLIIQKHLAVGLVLGLMLSGLPTASAEDAPRIQAKHAVVMSECGAIVYENNARDRALIASTTKLLTAILVLENCRLDESVLIKPEHCTVEGSSMYLRPGQSYTVEELLLGLLLVSGNDAALALAEHVSGDAEAFVEEMNRKAAALSLGDSHFENPHGLDAPQHYSSAYDLAKLMAYCMHNDCFSRLIREKSCKIHGLSFVNHNKLLRLCHGCLGGKTGYTKAAGRCLVSCCEREGTRFYCVTLQDPQDWQDHQRLYDWAFDRYTVRRPDRETGYRIPVVGGRASSIEIVAQPVEILMEKDQVLEICEELPPFAFAPIQAGEQAGRLRILANGQVLAETKLVYAESVPSLGSRPNLWERLRYATAR